jgi:hypothetical protein
MSPLRIETRFDGQNPASWNIVASLRSGPVFALDVNRRITNFRTEEPVFQALSAFFAGNPPDSPLGFERTFSFAPRGRASIALLNGRLMLSYRNR